MPVSCPFSVWIPVSALRKRISPPSASIFFLRFFTIVTRRSPHPGAPLCQCSPYFFYGFHRKSVRINMPKQAGKVSSWQEYTKSAPGYTNHCSASASETLHPHCLIGIFSSVSTLPLEFHRGHAFKQTIFYLHICSPQTASISSML